MAMVFMDFQAVNPVATFVVLWLSAMAGIALIPPGKLRLLAVAAWVLFTVAGTSVVAQGIGGPGGCCDHCDPWWLLMFGWCI